MLTTRLNYFLKLMASWKSDVLGVHWINLESRYRQSKVGLPQGSVSSPSLFNRYVNDLIKSLTKTGNFQVCMFTDDSVIWTKGRQQSELQKTAKHAASEFELYLDNINTSKITPSTSVTDSLPLNHLWLMRIKNINSMGVIWGVDGSFENAMLIRWELAPFNALLDFLTAFVKTAV
ncbi:hypothetical protein CEXT_147981 [Caerostris extrusa]|uniref:Reverse transcriptase domain-containing protein n=1 Tax=Caerostris extrusa TaxID=172846 RepID=A0AAV4RUA1_CAEEX|nr:hypothetical protein CEXT_147981 [Caerostris extrusa]